MLKWSFHQYSGYKKPFVWHITGVSPAGRVMYEFVRGVPTRRSINGKFGGFEFAITDPGLYKVGNTKDENGYRFVFLHSGIWRYRSLYDEVDAIKVARKLQAGETIDDLTQYCSVKLVRADFVDAHSPFDRLRANELKRTALRSNR